MGIWHNWAVYRRAQVIYGVAIWKKRGFNDGVVAVNLTEGAPALVGIHGNLHGSGTDSFTVFPSSANSQ